MADDDYVPGSMDISDQKSTYENVMKFSGYWGMPFSIALGTFFTALLADSGLLAGFFIFFLVFILTHIFVKMFFAH
ncbi:MAG: hypothetical protein MRY59_02100 [Aquisalinus sp.]|nr:hypothetical protein [Aquisalinus sp.]